MDPYLSAGLLLLVAAGLGLTMAVLPSLTGPRRPRERKYQPYECGMPPETGVQRPFSVHFYLVAMVFILFDVEVAFLVPWAVSARELGVGALPAVGAFLAVLAIGWGYLLRERILDVEKGGRG